MAMKNDSRVAVTRSRPRKQPGRDGRARAGHAGHQGEALDEADDDAVLDRDVALAAAAGVAAPTRLGSETHITALQRIEGAGDHPEAAQPARRRGSLPRNPTMPTGIDPMMTAQASE